MKKLFLTLCLTLSATVFCQPVWSAFSTHEMAKVHVNSLDFKPIMRALYAGKTVHYPLKDKSLITQPHIGLKESFDDTDTNAKTLAIMHPILTYTNHQGQTRYFVIIEKAAITHGDLMGDGTLDTTADLYVFKKVAGGYQLVSKSNEDIAFTNNWGQTNLDLEAIAKNMQPLGKNLTGSIIQNSHCSSLSCETWWQALFLPENDYIQTVLIADAGGSGGGMYEGDQPLSYGFDSTFKVINDGSPYYPITIHYTGEKPDDDYKYIKPTNHKQTVRFSPTKNQYQ